MHVDAAGQEAARRWLLTDALASEGVSVDIGSHYPCPDGLAEYRYVTKVGMGVSDRGRIRVGAWGRRFRIVPIPGCLAVAPVLRKTMK